MTQSQKIAVAASALIIIIAILCPPWKFDFFWAGYSFYFSPPDPVDYGLPPNGMTMVTVYREAYFATIAACAVLGAAVVAILSRSKVS